MFILIILTQSNRNYGLAQRIVVIKLNLSIKTQIKHVRSKSRIILWLTLPYDTAETNKLRKEFFKLL